MVERQDEVRGLIEGVPGFKAYYAVNGEGGADTTIAICASTAGADETTCRAGAWVRDNLAGAAIGAPQVSEGETYIAI